MALSREEKLLHILGAIDSGGEKGLSRDALEMWVQRTFRASGQAVYVYLKDIKTRRWAREVASRYVLTDDGRKELNGFKVQAMLLTLGAVQSPTT